MLSEAISLLGFRRRGRNIVDALEAAIRETRRGEGH